MRRLEGTEGQRAKEGNEEARFTDTTSSLSFSIYLCSRLQQLHEKEQALALKRQARWAFIKELRAGRKAAVAQLAAGEGGGEGGATGKDHRHNLPSFAPLALPLAPVFSPRPRNSHSFPSQSRPDASPASYRQPDRCMLPSLSSSSKP